MNMKRTVLKSILVITVFLISTVICFADTGDVASGNDHGVDWRITSDYELIIGKKGETQNLEYREYRNGSLNYILPWDDYKENIKRVSFAGTVKGNGSMNYLFDDFTNMTDIDLTYLDTSNVTEMSFMFGSCYSLTSLDLTSLDTSNVTDMYGMFSCCYSLTSLDLTSLDTSKVTTMTRMFEYCESLKSLDVHNFNTSKVTHMGQMFEDCESLTSLDVSTFDTSKVEIMCSMFHGCRSLTSLNLSRLDTSNVTDMWCMFFLCESLESIDVSSFDTGNVQDMWGMFKSCKSLTSIDVSGFDTKNVKSMGTMFQYCSLLRSLDLSKFDASKVEDMENMFGDCISLTTLKIGKNFNSNIYDSNCYAKFPVAMRDTNDNTEYAEGEIIPSIDYRTYISDILRSDYFILGKHNNSYWHIGHNFFNIKRFVFKNECDNAESLRKENIAVTVDSDEFEKCKKKSKKDKRIVKSDNAFQYGKGGYVEVSDPKGVTNYTAYFDQIKKLQSVDVANRDWFYTGVLYYTLHREWGGSCFGIESTSVLDCEGKLNDVFGDTNIYDLGLPKDNEKNLRDVINFYVLLQKMPAFTESYKTEKNPPVFSDSKTKKEFLKMFVAEAKKSQETHKPFMLSYNCKSGGGHTVVVCGYAYDSPREEHLITIYDCNHRWEFLPFRVKEDYSDFSYVAGDGDNISKNYESLVVQDIDLIDSFPIVDTGKTKTSTKKSQKSISDNINMASPEDTSTIVLSAYEPCTITNDTGKTLVYDGETYIATMGVYDERIIVNENSEIEFTVDASNSFTISNVEKGAEFFVSTDVGDYSGVTATDADSIIISKDSIIIEGQNYEYDLMKGKENNELEFAIVTGTGNGKIEAELNEDFTLEMENANSDFSITVITNDGSEQSVSVDENVDKISVDETGSITDISGQDDPCASGHTWNTAYTVDVPATESAPGSQSIHCSVCGAIKEGSSIEIPQLTPSTPNVAPPAPTAPAEIVDLPAVKISKPAAAKKSVNVKWKKVSKANLKKIQGIEIQVATDSSFTDIVKTSTAGKKKTSKKIKGLTSKQTYYVRIRAYNNAADGRHVSAWKMKKIKVK